MNRQHIAKVLRPRFVAVPPRRVPVNVLHIAESVRNDAQVEVGIMMFGAPRRRFRAARARYPDGRMRLLQRHLERIDLAEVVVFPLPAERPRRSPGFHHQVMSFLKPLPVINRVAVRRPAFGAAAAHKSRHQPPPGNAVNFRQLLSQPQRVVVNRQRIAHQHDFRLVRNAGQNGGFQVHRRPQAGRRAVMLVQHHPVKPDFLAVFPLVQVVVILVRRHHRVKMGVGESYPVRPVGTALNILLGVVEVSPLGEPHHKHNSNLSTLDCVGLKLL